MGYYGSPNAPSLHWVRCMEDVARKHYLAHHRLNTKHRSVSWQPTGLWVSIQCPFIAASPDGIISCQQCGKGLLEIKNPYKYKNSTIHEFTSKVDTCLIHCNGVTHLDRKHDYYYQIQFQLWVTGFQWCDFVLRTNSQMDNIFVERLVQDNNFISNILPKLNYFFYYGIIPELKSRSVQGLVILNAVLKQCNE
ncbi:hypothetical protein HOLleu_36583 [Holothuria leucospilota]|uniref:YqaJ viral recombinase domain-containing protein n=1 Tax=Holothuria leucospilota TaxID=206669 RepID=A0A9Q1BGQ8_HOLLE|nr:hypothetical protein HOLleu_36583 [Holothuria leucospilota]